MNKKVSLKDAFVKNLEPNRDTGVQAGGGTVSQQGGDTARQQLEVQVPGSLYAQPARYPAAPLKKKATFNLDAALHQRLKVAAAMHSREMVDIVQDALQAYLPALDKKAG